MQMKPDVKIAWLQADLAWENPKANRKYFEAQIQSLDKDCDLIVLPETFTTGFPVDPKQFAEPENGESMDWMRQMAEQTGAVVCGSLLIETNGFFSNTLIWMRPDGSFERYDKRHVFSMGGENESIKAGTKQLTAELKGWKIRPMVCYDLRFPVWSKNRLLENGDFEYDLAIYIANWPAVRSYPWKQLLIARAIENLAYVLGVNRVGTDGPGNVYSGDSMLVDFKGGILAMAKEGEEQTFIESISMRQLQAFRQKFNAGLDWDRFKLYDLQE
ncbi:MAG: amidohydrolase [Bacteroidales bacterium]|nr:amidohydrolase [Bacteroidales bacterium]